MIYRYALITLIIFAAGCTPPLTVDDIIDKSIDAYGGGKVNSSIIEFDFRSKHYSAKYHNYKYELIRSFSDSTGLVVDVLNNDGFTRTINDSIVMLDDKWSGKYSRSVNSVIYFFRIPFIMKDEAVKPELIGEATIKDQTYHKVRITFSEQGGGDDYDDSFIYWVNQENFFIDYFAYSYSTDGGGKRFREAINPRNIIGLRTTDYINYEPKDLQVAIEDYDTYFIEGGMKELSRIENKNISIEYLD